MDLFQALPFHSLSTARLVLRELRPSDASELFIMRSDPQVMEHIGRPRAATLADAEKLIETIAEDQRNDDGITWAITLKESDNLIGTIGYYRLKKAHFRGEVGYSLMSDHWRKGYMGEALEAVVACGFEQLGFHSIEAVTDPRNIASNTLLERHGFVREGLFKENYHWNGEFLDSAVWSRIAPK
jgi:[ribosomal protein S5]-alanine N-acetyltransferase